MVLAICAVGIIGRIATKREHKGEQMNNLVIALVIVLTTHYALMITIGKDDSGCNGREIEEGLRSVFAMHRWRADDQKESE